MLKNAPTYDEMETLRQFQSGSHQAFAVIYDQFYPSIFYYIKNKLGDADKANDITAECFIKFWKSGKRDFDSMEGVKSYLLRTAINATINAHRDLKTDTAHQQDIQYQLQINESETFRDEDEYRADLMRMVLSEVEKLPKKARQIFKLAYFEGYKNEEIAQHLHLSQKTVRNQKNRALIQLRIRLMQKKINPLLLAQLALMITILDRQ